MQGSVIWESKAQGEVWEGKVTRCVVRGEDINVVFDCKELGEGQLTLTNMTGQQLVIGRFLYYGRHEATRVSVRGGLSGRLNVIVFEGAWTDPLDGTAEWQFFLEVEGVDGLATSVTPAILDSAAVNMTFTHLVSTLTPGLFTEHYDFDVNPSRPGIYRVREVGQRQQDPSWYSWWDGVNWSATKSTIEGVLKLHTTASEIQSSRSSPWVASWYGLTEEGWHAMREQLKQFGDSHGVLLQNPHPK